jgi:hypothetical protein
VKYDADTYLDAKCLLSLNGLAVEQRMEIYADNVDEFISGQPKVDAIRSAADVDGETEFLISMWG